MSISLKVDRPFDSEAFLSYLRIRAIPGVEQIVGACYSRSFRFGNATGVVHVDLGAAEEGVVTAGCSPSLRLESEALKEMTGRFVDADAPVERIAVDLESDPLLGPLIRWRPGVRIPGTFDPFELAVRAIVGQQISVAAAAKLAARIAVFWGTELPTACGALRRTFPTSGDLVEAPLESAGISRGRASAIRDLAAAVTQGQLSLEPQFNLQQTEESLLAIKGIGPWTASYIALRGLQDHDAIPVGDLGLRQVANCGSPRELSDLAASWKPWRGYAAAYLWCTFLGLD